MNEVVRHNDQLPAVVPPLGDTVAKVCGAGNIYTARVHGSYSDATTKIHKHLFRTDAGARSLLGPEDVYNLSYLAKGVEDRYSEVAVLDPEYDPTYYQEIQKTVGDMPRMMNYN